MEENKRERDRNKTYHRNIIVLINKRIPIQLKELTETLIKHWKQF